MICTNCKASVPAICEVAKLSDKRDDKGILVIEIIDRLCDDCLEERFNSATRNSNRESTNTD